MKKTIAILLCVMMVLTTLSLPAMAMEGSVTSYATIKDIVGADVEAAYTFDFSSGEMFTGETKWGISFTSGEPTFDVENGMTLTNGQYARLIKKAWWAPLGAGESGSVAAFTAKTEDEFMVFWQGPTLAQEKFRAGIRVTPEEISQVEGAQDSVGVFAPGTGWVDYLLVADTAATWSLYAKSDATDGKYILVRTGTYGNNGGDGTGLYFSAPAEKTFYVKSATIYDKILPTYDTVKDIVGEEIVSIASFDMTNEDYKSTSGFVFKPEGEHTQNGVFIDGTLGGPGLWRYSPQADWSPVAIGKRIATFTLKVEEGNSMEVLIQSPSTPSTYGSFKISPDAFWYNNFKTLSYYREDGPGTDFVDYMIIAEDEMTISLYAKNLDGDGKWVLAARSYDYAQTNNANIGLYFAGTGYLKTAELFNIMDKSQIYDGIDDIIGASHYAFKTFDFTGAKAEELYTAKGHDHSGVSFDNLNGMTLSGDAPRWRWSNYTEAWSAIDEGRVVYFKAKVQNEAPMTVYFKQPNDETEKQEQVYVLNIAATGVTSDADAETKVGFAPGTDWAEYLVRANDNGGYNVWVKAESFGDNKWYLLAETTAYNYENGSGNIGLRFRCNDTCQAYLDYANVYTTEGVIAENTTLPSGADYKYFEETFDTADLLHNVKIDGMTTENGNLVVAEGKGEGTATLANLTIPKGGYAEFKTAGHNINALEFSDGNGSLLLSHNGIQASVGTSGDNYSITDGGNTYRTWRVVRNTDGTYNGYTMTEGDGVWVKVFENKASVTNVNPAQILMIAGNTNVKYDYIKVYGPAPAPEGELVIYDGFGTEPLAVTNGVAKISYYGALRMVVKKGATQKNLILAEVKDGLLTNLSIVPVEAGTGIMTHEYAMKDKEATLKVLLWNDFSNLTMADMGAQLTVK